MIGKRNGLTDDRFFRSAVCRFPVQVEVDPGQLGGLVIRVGDEVIDGSIATRLAQARQELSG